MTGKVIYSLIRAMITLYNERYSCQLFFKIIRRKNAFPSQVVAENIYVECVVPKKLGLYDRQLLREFESDYFFDKAFQTDKNSTQKIHLDLINYYVINAFNKKSHQEHFPSWVYKIKSTPEEYDEIVGLCEEKEIFNTEDYDVVDKNE